MSRKKFDQDENSFFEDLFDSTEESVTKYKVIVEFVLDADGHEEAQAKINELIKEGVLAIAVDEEKDIGYTYDIIDCEVAEIDM